MGKRGHHQKNLKKEKSKVKFKVGRSLPKGQNITDTSFKVKKIVIKEQLKTGGLEPVTKRHLNLKETLSRLNHYNTNVKLDNLAGLKEILSVNKELLSGNLQSVLEKLAELISDKESSVRREAIAQLAHVIGQVPPHKLTPFLCLICSYLGAALSHINKDIQLDALLLLDGVLSNHAVSSLILNTPPASPNASHPFDLILQGLINQISEQKESSAKEKSGWERQLSVNLGSKLADTQRRLKILHQLRMILKAALDVRRRTVCNDIPADDSNSVAWKDIVRAGGYVTISEPSYRSTQNISLSKILTSSFDVPISTSSSEPFGQLEKLKMIVISLVPILLESWKEILPMKDAGPNYLLTAESAELLKTILDILVIILEALTLYDKESAEALGMVKWFRMSYSRSFFDLLMPIYPFSCSGFAKKKKRKRGKQNSEKNGNSDGIEMDNERLPTECFYQSLLMTQLYCTLEVTPASVKKQHKKSSRQTYLTKMLTFLTTSFSDSVICHSYGKQISEIVWRVVSCGRIPTDAQGNWCVAMDEVELLVKSVINCCDAYCPHLKSSRADNCPFFKLLCNILKENHLTQVHRLSCFEDWMVRLPELLCFPCPSAVNILCQMARRCNIAAFHSKIKAIIPELLLYLKSNPEFKTPEGRKDLIKTLLLFHWMKNWDQNELNSLGEVVQMFPEETSSLIELFRARKDYYGKESEFSIYLESSPWWQKVA